MNLLILAAAAALALPLPEGRGGPRLIPLEVHSQPAGATAILRYRDGHGGEHLAMCTTPCTLQVPRASPFIFDVEKDGQGFAKPPIAWGFKGLSGPNLYPSVVMAVLPVAAH